VASPVESGYCAKHDKRYGKLEQCSECRKSRGITVKQESPKADTATVRVHAARYRLNEAACWNEFKRYSAVDLTAGSEDDDPVQIDPHVAVKFSAEAGKWAGRADELEMRILEIEHDQWLREQKRIMGGGSGN
jgi:hypothetical protein